MTASHSISVSASISPETRNEKIDPSRATSGVARWRRALAEAQGEDRGARLDAPDRMLVMLRIFGATRRLADLCLKHPAAAAEALTDGPSGVLAEAARDLSALHQGVGGPDALHGALAPLKNRADIAIAIAELSGAWSARQATAARADLAERLIEVALAWLLRGAVNRGELAAFGEDGAYPRVFALAGGDFAHEDLAPYGPVEVIVVYDDAAIAGPAARMAERAFVRLGAELRETFEGRPGDYPLFALRTPFGSCVNGAGLSDSCARVLAAAAAPTAGALRAWLATARVVGGDRRAGGEFLERAEALLWDGAPLDGEARAALVADSADPRAPFAALASLFRVTLGGARPVLRTASAHEVFAIAAASGLLAPDLAERLRAGADFANGFVARAQMMKGAGAAAPFEADEEAALADLCGFGDPAALTATLAGQIADARDALSRILTEPASAFERYRPHQDGPVDAEKLEDLGFRSGVELSGVVDGWASRAAPCAETRFSAIAPGLLSAFGETQHPDAAARLFDAIIAAAPKDVDIIGALCREGELRDGVVAALGCFDAALGPLGECASLARLVAEKRGSETPRNAREWLGRYAPPAAGAPVADIACWRRENIARIALYAACGDIGFDGAAASLEAVNNETLARVMAATAAQRGAGEGLALHVFDGPGRGLPGAPTLFGFIATDGDANAHEAFARDVVEALDGLGAGFFAFHPDLSHRPGGAAGPLVPDVATFKSFVHSEAVAYDQILLARARVIAGSDKARKTASAALRTAVASPRRADTLFRDLDRARAQRLRRDRAASDWDIDQAEGGLHDVELILGALMFRHAAAQPAIQQGDAEAALDLLARAGAMPQTVADTLKGARAFWLRLATARALSRWSDPHREPVRARFAHLLARAAEVDRFAQVRPIMRGYAEEVTRLYAQFVLGRPSLSLVANG